MKVFLHFFYFIIPFFVWFLIYLQKPDLVVILKRPVNEKSLILPIENLWQIILVFLVIQIGNEILARFLPNYKIFGKIQLIFIFCHFLVAFYLLIFNFF